MNLFKVLFGFDCLVALGVLIYFILGLMDGSVSSFNMKLWIGLLAVVFIILFGAWFLHSKQMEFISKLLLWILAAPGILMILYILMFIIFKPKF